MAKIPFDIKYRPQIESGEYKVETRDGRPARIICWDKIADDYPLVALILGKACEIIYTYTTNGKIGYGGTGSNGDLFLITPEPELKDDLEKDIDAFFDKWDKNSNGSIFDENGTRVTIEIIKDVVKHFLNARKYE